MVSESALPMIAIDVRPYDLDVCRFKALQERLTAIAVEYCPTTDPSRNYGMTQRMNIAVTQAMLWQGLILLRPGFCPLYGAGHGLCCWFPGQPIREESGVFLIPSPVVDLAIMCKQMAQICFRIHDPGVHTVTPEPHKGAIVGAGFKIFDSLELA